MKYLYMLISDLAAIGMILFVEVIPLITPRQTWWFVGFGIYRYVMSGVDVWAMGKIDKQAKEGNK